MDIVQETTIQTDAPTNGHGTRKEETIHPRAVREIDLTKPVPSPLTGHLHLGGANPDGIQIESNSRYLLRAGRPWLPVMGEFHYSRYPADDWRDELLKIKAGGVQIVASYLFWIHHEEIQDEFDFSGQRDLRRFVQTCQDVGLDVIVRLGPWAHGECRNGGFPDWLLGLCQTRTNDPAYLEFVRIWWTQVQAQLQGLYFKDGGPIVGAQLENELMDDAAHLLTLKQLARDIGIETPLYTATGWGYVKLPEDEILPIYGGYTDGFWEREIVGLPTHYRVHYFFNHHRNDLAIGADLRPTRQEPGTEIDPARYPYLTCELGGGMEVSYHRRPLITAADTAAMALVKVGSGGNLLGYYMYHGGVNPEGKRTALQESQATGYPNDLPTLSYDYRAPLGAFGQRRESYRCLRCLHLFLADFGSELAPLVSVLPDDRPTGLEDRRSLRWAVRADHRTGFLFVNNHQRLETLPAHHNVQFHLRPPGGTLTLPRQPITVPSGASFIWPFCQEWAGIRLRYATAQLLCRVPDREGTCYIFFAIDGIAPEFIFEAETVREIKVENGAVQRGRDTIRVHNLRPGTDSVIDLTSAEGRRCRILLLTEAQALGATKATFGEAERLLLSEADPIVEPDRLRITHPAGGALFLRAFPPLKTTPTIDGKPVTLHREGAFSCFTIESPSRTVPVACTWIQDALPPGPVKIGPAGVAEVPPDWVFADAARWHITLPDDLNLDDADELLLRINYVGDIARLYAGTGSEERLLLDDFYHGSLFEIGLKRFGAEILRAGLSLAILPLREDAPFYLPPGSRPDFAGRDAVAELRGIEAIVIREVTVRPGENSP